MTILFEIRPSSLPSNLHNVFSFYNLIWFVIYSTNNDHKLKIPKGEVKFLERPIVFRVGVYVYEPLFWYFGRLSAATSRAVYQGGAPVLPPQAWGAKKVV